MNVNLGIWDKLSKLAIFLLFLAGLTWVFFWYLPLIQKNQNYRKRSLMLEAEIAQQERIDRQLKANIDTVQNDPKTVERLARETLGWARTNEVVVHFEAPKANGPQR
jgi:cell division protein FtsB